MQRRSRNSRAPSARSAKPRSASGSQGPATGAHSPFDFKSNDPATIERVQGTPEPGTLLLLGAGLLGLAGFRRRSS